MSAVDTMLRHGNEVLFATDSDEFEILNGSQAGTRFRANIQVAAPTSPEALLGEDKRETSTLYCIRPGPPLAQEDQILGKNATWLVVDREDNPADDCIKYEVKKVVPGKDQ